MKREEIEAFAHLSFDKLCSKNSFYPHQKTTAVVHHHARQTLAHQKPLLLMLAVLFHPIPA